MNAIKLALAESILNKHALCDKVLQYTNENTESKAERLYGTITSIINVL